MPPESRRPDPRQEVRSSDNTITDDFDDTRCRRCKRILRADVAVRRGCGWRCAAHLRAEAVAA